MRQGRRGRRGGLEFGGSGEDSFVAVVVTKLTGALLFILLLTMVIMALIPRADGVRSVADSAVERGAKLEIVSSARLPDAVVGRPYELALAARGVKGEATWSLAGDLPEGLEFDGSRGVLRGVPGAATRPAKVLVAMVRDGSEEATRGFTLEVLEPAGVGVASAVLGAGGRLAAWLEQGFGFVVLLLIWMLGMSVVGSLERSAFEAERETGRVRFVVYRAFLSVGTVAAMGMLGLWLWNFDGAAKP